MHYGETLPGHISVEDIPTAQQILPSRCPPPEGVNLIAAAEHPHGRSAAQLDRAMDVGVELFPGCEVAADGVALPRPVGTVYPPRRHC
jgi:hypothetical protein